MLVRVTIQARPHRLAKVSQKKKRVGWRPMKCQNYEEKKVVYPCMVQAKLNGLRAYFDGVNFITGDGVIWDNNVVEPLLIDAIVAKMEKSDGEFYLHGASLQEINRIIGVGRKSQHPEVGTVGFFVFDSDEARAFAGYGKIPSNETRLYSVVTRVDRYYKMCLAAKKLPRIHRVPTWNVSNKREADAFYKQCIEEGYEGIVYRLPHCPKIKSACGVTLHDNIDTGYVQDARPHWMLKRKDKFDAEFIVAELLEGKVTDKGGKHVGRMGAVVCFAEDGKHTFHVGSGFSDQQRQEYWDNRKNHNKSIIGKKLRVEYGRLSDGKIPVEPRAWDGCIRDYS